MSAVDKAAAVFARHDRFESPQGTDQCKCGRAVDGRTGWSIHVAQVIGEADGLALIELDEPERDENGDLGPPTGRRWARSSPAADSCGAPAGNGLPKAPSTSGVSGSPPGAWPGARKKRKLAMVTTDPVETAVERAWASVHGRVTVHDEGQRRIAAAAARAALAPVRAWFEANERSKVPDLDALAELIYASEELEHV